MINPFRLFHRLHPKRLIRLLTGREASPHEGGVRPGRPEAPKPRNEECAAEGTDSLKPGRGQ